MEVLNTNSLDEAIASLFGENLRIVSKRPVYGGDINDAFRLSLSDGTAVFMKSNTLANLPFFASSSYNVRASARIKRIQQMSRTD